MYLSLFGVAVVVVLVLWWIGSSRQSTALHVATTINALEDLLIAQWIEAARWSAQLEKAGIAQQRDASTTSDARRAVMNFRSLCRQPARDYSAATSVCDVVQAFLADDLPSLEEVDEVDEPPVPARTASTATPDPGALDRRARLDRALETLRAANAETGDERPARAVNPVPYVRPPRREPIKSILPVKPPRKDEKG